MKTLIERLDRNGKSTGFLQFGVKYEMDGPVAYLEWSTMKNAMRMDGETLEFYWNFCIENKSNNYRKIET